MPSPKLPGSLPRWSALAAVAWVVCTSAFVLGQPPVLGKPAESDPSVDELPKTVEGPPLEVPITIHPSIMPPDPAAKMEMGILPPPALPTIKTDSGVLPPPGLPVRVDSGYLPAPVMAWPVAETNLLPKFIGPPAAIVEKHTVNLVEKFVEPEMGIDLIVGVPRLVILRDRLERLQIAGGDDHNSPVSCDIANQRELTLLGRRVGHTVLNLWFADPAVVGGRRIVSYVIRVFPDIEHFLELEKLINETFPRSRVELKVAGPNLLVKGMARNAQEAEQILRIVQPAALAAHQPQEKSPLNTPFAEEYSQDPPLCVVNLLQIMPERQVMLRVAVTEVDRSMMQNLGLSGSQMARLDARQLSQALDGLRSMNMARTLYETTLVARGSQALRVQNGPANSASAFRPASATDYPFGINMVVMPLISDADEITLNFEGEISAGAGNAIGANRRTFQSVVAVGEGQTLAVGGARQTIHGAAKVPGRFPLLGGLMQREQPVDSELELIVTITPELVRQHTVSYRPVVRSRK